MSDQFLGEIRPLPYTFAPYGWAFCNGQLMAIAQNTALFSLLGTQFGGNGTSNFALPNLQGRWPINTDFSTNQVGTQAGSETVTLALANMPQHSHAIAASPSDGTSSSPGNAVLASAPPGTRGTIYSTGAPAGTMSALMIQPFGGTNAPIATRSPFLTLNFCISLTGIFPSRS